MPNKYQKQLREKKEERAKLVAGRKKTLEDRLKWNLKTDSYAYPNKLIKENREHHEKFESILALPSKLWLVNHDNLNHDKQTVILITITLLEVQLSWEDIII